MRYVKVARLHWQRGIQTDLTIKGIGEQIEDFRLGVRESMEAVPMILPGPVIRENHSSGVSSLMSVIRNTRLKRKENLASE